MTSPPSRPPWEFWLNGAGVIVIVVVVVVVVVGVVVIVEQSRVGSFASQDFDSCLRGLRGSFAEICED